MIFIEENSRIWDERSARNDKWSVPVTSEMIRQARDGSWSIVLTTEKPVPRDWFPERLDDKKVLCLASGWSALDQYIHSSMATKAIKL